MSLSAFAKLRRGAYHLQALKDEIARYGDRDPYSFVFETHPDNRTVVRLQVREHPPLGLWSAIVGDCAHNIRSALDHVIWDLTDQDFTVDDTRTQFPIFTDPKKFYDNGRAQIAKIPRRAKTIVALTQPYHRPNPVGASLYGLHALDVADKHKLVPVFVMLLEHTALAINCVNCFVSNPGTAWDSQSPFEDGAVFGEVWYDKLTVIDDSLPFSVNVNLNVRFFIVLSKESPPGLGNVIIGDALATFLSRATYVVKLLARDWPIDLESNPIWRG